MKTYEKYLKEEKYPFDKAWDEFEKVAKKELGPKWDGSVRGAHLFGGGLSKKAVDLYWKYFKLIPKKK